MKKKWIWILLPVLLFTGCAKQQDKEETLSETAINSEPITEETTISPQSSSLESAEAVITETAITEATVTKADWSDYFDGINGTAVLYNPNENTYQIYQEELANTRRSPCSTFKIISSLIGLEQEIIIPDASTKKWSGGFGMTTGIRTLTLRRHLAPPACGIFGKSSTKSDRTPYRRNWKNSGMETATAPIGRAVQTPITTTAH